MQIHALRPALRRGAPLALALLAHTALAQEPQPPRDLPATPDLLRVPLHTAPDDPQSDTPYGLWAMGPTYKAAFHNGFEFVPLLGSAAPHNLPLRWRTASISRAGTELTDEHPRTSHDDWLFRRRWAAVTEAYELRAEGVEQTFTLRTLPVAPGADLVVTAAIDTPLHATERAPEHAALTFRDGTGRAVVEYGAGVVFDAAGRRAPLRTGFADGRLTLVVDGAWLDAATLPVTIDPLVRTVIIDSDAGGIEYSDLVRNDELDEWCIVHSVAASASDFDQIATIANDSLTRFTRVFSDVTTLWSATHGRVTFVGGADRYAIAIQRSFPASDNSLLRVYLHDGGDLSLNSGRTLFATLPAGEQWADPVIGGVHARGAATHAMAVFRVDVSPQPANTDHSRVFALPVDCVARTLGTRVGIGGDGQTIDAEAPSINRLRAGGAGEPWIVSWQEHSNRSGASWRILARQVQSDRSITTHTTLAAGSRHAVRAKVDGAFGRYLAAWVVQPNTRKTNSSFGFRIDARRFDWAAGGGTVDAGPIRSVASATLQNLQLDASHPLAFDTDTDSHWMVAWAERGAGVFAARLGFDARTSEHVTLRPDIGTDRSEYPALAYDDDRERFLATYTTRSAPSRLRLAQIDMPPAAVRNFGDACPARLDSRNNGDDLPYAGSEFHDLIVGGAPTDAPVVMAFGLAQAGTPLPLPGGCSFRLDPAALLGTFPAGNTDGSGRLILDVPIESTSHGDLFLQAIILDGLALRASRGLQLTIR